ncbi:Nn.00g064300.m01.CDS01 [Neocucurbitaria sp. VM-36]
MASKDNKKVTKTQTNRLPAPALFVGPPSRNASNTSLLPSGTETRTPAKTPLVRQRSLLSPDSKRPLPPTTSSHYDGEHLNLTTSNTSAPFQRRQRQQSEAADAEASSRAEAIWAEMQNTLEEVELSAIKGPGMTVFGSEHSRALDELRRAQIELAKAWARSEAEENETSNGQQKKVQDISATNLAPQSGRARAGSNAASKEDKLFDRIKLEEETEKDIELSRKRREENDRYFEKVNKGVQEVVVRLEDVAKAMRGVESESKEIWGHGSDVGVDTESVISTQSIR